jgi:hypothetical protein
VTPEESPWIVREVGFDFHWDERKVWALDVPVEEMELRELTWHFDIPFLRERGQYDLTPREVLDHPEVHRAEHARMLRADLNYPLDIMENKGRWLLLDGLHRLMKAARLGMARVRVRKIPRDRIPDIVP